MPDSGQLGAADTPLRLLSSVHYLTDGELPQLYDYPDDGTWLRANFISSLDGGATVDGTSGAMAGPGDRFVFNLLRELADVIVVGVGTVRIEGYSGVRMGVVQRQHRQARGQSEVPQLAIVTRSGRLDRDMAVFTRTEMAPLVLTTTAVADDTRQRLAGLAEVIACSGEIRARSMRQCSCPSSRLAVCAGSLPKAGRRCSGHSSSVTCSTSCV